MAGEAPQTLLAAEDPPPVGITNGEGRSLFLLLGDHAGNLIPRRLEALGLGADDLARHIAWDIGVAALGRLLAERLDATFVEQRYSRLVVDCNRSRDAADSISEISDSTIIPGNLGPEPQWKERRYSEIYEPYHRVIEQILDERSGRGRRTIIVSLHSFAPVLAGEKRPWDIGVLYDGGVTSFARCVLGELTALRQWTIGDNAPYRMDRTDFTVPQHCYARRLPYGELELRQDHLGSPHVIDTMARLLGDALSRSATGFSPDK